MDYFSFFFLLLLDPQSFDQGLVGQSHVAPISIRPRSSAAADLHVSGAGLASRALAYGSLLAVGGCSLLFAGIWKLSGAKDFKEFRQICGGILPKIPKKKSQGNGRYY